MSSTPAPSRPAADEARPGRTDVKPAKKADGFRPEIQGLRAISVLLVAVYHIWFNRVSGGVDIFLLLTGFFITGSLLRMVEREGRVRFGAFFSRLLSRLAPAAGLVLLAILAGAFFILPDTRWRDVIAEVVASALYYENWQLSFSAVDYLAQGGASPLQHFWSLSIQGQFYVLWALMVTAAVFLGRRTRLGLRGSIFAGTAAVFAVSLSYSVYITAAAQTWAYFDTGARLWEFAVGAMLALALPWIKLPRRLRIVLGWTGLAGLVSCGALLNVGGMFPGYVALWPVAAAVLFVLAGSTESRIGADRVLSWRPISYIGDIGYPLYLWHWPILVFYLEATRQETASVLEGLGIMAVSIALAAATKELVEDRSIRFARVRPRRLVLVGAGFLVPVLLATLTWSAVLNRQADELEEAASDNTEYPGAAVLDDPQLAADLPDLPPFPDPADAHEDQPETYATVDGFRCEASLSDTEAKVCEFGDLDSEHTIAVVGASRTEHWFAAVRAVAEANDWHMINITKSACRFDTGTPRRAGEVYESCIEWRENALDELTERRPDVVFTSSTYATREDGEKVPSGYLERWEQLDALGVDVVGVRDLPVLPFDGPECVAREGAENCVAEASGSQADVYPALELENPPDNATFIDMTEYVCPDGMCQTVTGNVTVYLDSAHITDTYVRTMAPMLEKKLKAATGW
ncbi:MAG: acyltransferase family protein [Stackebrandtia sp.]